MERMRELVQASTSSSTELAASSDQMSKMSRGLLGSMDRFGLHSSDGASAAANDRQNDGTNDRTNDRINDSTPAFGRSARAATAR
jgi:hypothetical protein